MQRVFLFIFSLLSLFGLFVGIINGDSIVGWDWGEFIFGWFVFSVPLIIFLMAKIIFRF